MDDRSRPVTDLKREDFSIVEDGNPQSIAHFQLCQISDTDLTTGTFSVTLQQGKASKRWNPMTTTDGAGKFTLVTDRRDWEETQRVVLHAKIFRNLRNYEGVISSPASPTPLTIRVEKGPKKLPGLDLGDVVFRVK